MSAELNRIGAQMANVMFNLAQLPGERITYQQAETFDSLRKQWDAARRATPALTGAGELPPLIYVRKATLDLIAGSSFVKHDIVVRTEPNDGWVALGAIAADRAQQAVVAPSGLRIAHMELSDKMGQAAAENIALRIENEDLRAQLARQGQGEPVAFCVPENNGKPSFGKGWMFAPVEVGAATMPLYASPAQASAAQSASSAQVPVAQVGEQSAATADAARLNKFIDWYLSSKRFAEIDPWGHVRTTTREHILNWLDGGSNDLPGLLSTKGANEGAGGEHA